MLVQDLNIRVINAATGELLRELTLDPTRDYQPTGSHPKDPPENENTRTYNRRSGCCRCPETSHGRAAVCCFRTSETGVSRHRKRSWRSMLGVSKARLVITAVVIEGRSQSEVARDYGVSRAGSRKLVARYRAEGDAAFEPRSRRPTAPTGRPRPDGRRADPRAARPTRRRRPRRRSRHHRLAPRTPPQHAASRPPTIDRHLTAPAWSRPSRRSDPKSSYIRFQADQPNETLAIRLHPLPARRWHRHRDPLLARRPLPLRALTHRPPPRHRPDRASPRSAKPSTHTGFRPQR